MAESDWGEVHRLAASLRRLQQSSIAHRLTERSCVELVTTLVKRHFVEILYTLDGKEYVTPGQLVREIKDELVAHGGRINVIDLQQALNVDLSHIEARIGEMIKHDRSLTLLHGEIIEREYMQRLCEEIDDLIEVTGQASLADLSRNFSLPINFLAKHIEAALDTSGYVNKFDFGIIYTETYVKRYKSRIRGVFHAIKVPMAISCIITEGKYHEKLFNTILQELISSGEIAGRLQGRQDKAVYIPHIYVDNQNSWVDHFLEANGYLEYDALSRLGIDDPRQYISHRYCGNCEDGSLVLLHTCCIGKAVISRVEGVVEDEVFGSAQWVDAMPLMPSPCTQSDAELLLQHLWSSQPELRIFGSVLTTKTFLYNCCKLFESTITQRAQIVTSGKLADVSVVKDEEKKSSSSRKGGGKKAGKRKGRDIELEEGRLKLSLQNTFLKVDEITTELIENLPNCPEALLSEVAAEVERKVHECMSSLTQATPPSELRKKHSKLEEKVQALWNMLQLFEKATSHFQGDIKLQLNRFLLRTICSDIFNLLLKYVAEDNGVKCPADMKMNAEVRPNIIGLLPTPLKSKMTTVNTALNGKVVAAFFPLFEDVCAEEYCGVMLKRLDKKTERQLLFSHRQSLIENLQSEKQPSMVLHLVVVILFQESTNCAIHVSGKLIPHVILFLHSHIERDKYIRLTEFEAMLIKHMSMDRETRNDCGWKSECGTEFLLLQKELDDTLDNLKQLVIKLKPAVKQV